MHKDWRFNASDEDYISAIARALVIMARSNTILINTKNSKEEYKKLEDYVYIKRQ